MAKMQRDLTPRALAGYARSKRLAHIKDPVIMCHIYGACLRWGYVRDGGKRDPNSWRLIARVANDVIEEYGMAGFNKSKAIYTCGEGGAPSDPWEGAICPVMDAPCPNSAEGCAAVLDLAQSMVEARAMLNG